MKIRTFRTTPEHAAKLQPFIGAPLLTEDGIVLGIELYTHRVVMWDPWKMKAEGTIHSPVVWFHGQKGGGKSATIKSLLARLTGLQAGVVDGVPRVMRWRAHSFKPEAGKASEYQLMSDALQGTFFSIEDASINIFDPQMHMTEADMVETAVNVSEMISGQHPLPDYQVPALQVAINKMYKNDEARRNASPEVLRTILWNLTAQDLISYEWEGIKPLFDEQPNLEQALGVRQQMTGDDVTGSEFKHDASKAASYLMRLQHGEIGNLFGAKRSLRQVLSTEGLVLEWGSTNAKATAIIMSLIMEWQKRALHRGDYEMIPNIDAGDEQHEAMTNLMYARFSSRWIKEIRAYESVLLRATQYETDVTKSGEAGSELRALAEGMMLGTGIRFVGHLPDNDQELLDTYRRFGMSKLHVKALTKLQPGCFAIVIQGRPPLFYQHVLTEIEYPLVETDTATKRMLHRLPVASFNGLSKQAKRKGIVRVGENEEVSWGWK